MTFHGRHFFSNAFFILFMFLLFFKNEKQKQKMLLYASAH